VADERATLGEGEGAASVRETGLVAVLRETPLTLLGLVAVAIFLFWAPSNAGYDAVVWYPAGLAFVALLLGVTLARATTGRPPRLVLAAIGVFAAFAALNYASIAWADAPGVAFDGANRTLLYVGIFSVFALIPWHERAAGLVVGTYGVGVAAIAFATIVRAASSSHPGSFLIEGRLAEPAGYPNANAALFLTAAWPLLAFSSRRSVQPVLRVVALVSAGVLFDVSLVCQSRGGVLATIIVTPVFLALVPRRGRVLVAMAAVGGATAVAGPALLDVYSSVDSTATLKAAFQHAAHRLGLAAALLVVAGAVWVWIDTRLELTGRTDRQITLALRIGAVVTVVGLVLAALAAHPVRHVQDAWSSFRHKGTPAGDTTRFVSLGSNRYDFYRVALREFRDHPWLGVGSDGFAVDYVRERRSDEEPLYPHTSVLRIPAQTGLVGSALVLLLFGLVTRIVLTVRRTPAWPTAAALLGGFAYFLVHSAADWLWEFPGLTGPALMLAGMVVGLAPRQEAIPAPRRLGFRLALVPPVVILVLLFGAPWLSARQVDSASASWRSDPAGAFSQIDRAARLNPLSAQPYLVGGAIASRLGDVQRVQREFDRALDREPDNWYATLELGVVESQRGHWAAALRIATRAQALDPLEPTVSYALARIRRHRPVAFETLDRSYRERLEQRIGSGLRGA
jgi:hypothetical protein